MSELYNLVLFIPRLFAAFLGLFVLPWWWLAPEMIWESWLTGAELEVYCQGNQLSRLPDWDKGICCAGFTCWPL